jgi:hypothetical protein
VAEGTNRLIDPYDPAAIVGAARAALAAPMPVAGHRPELWDGHTAERVVSVTAGGLLLVVQTPKRQNGRLLGL